VRKRRIRSRSYPDLPGPPNAISSPHDSAGGDVALRMPSRTVGGCSGTDRAELVPGDAFVIETLGGDDYGSADGLRASQPPSRFS